MGKIALITGATSGIGEALAQRFASKKYNLILTGRRSEKLLSLSEALRKKFAIEVLPLVFDV
ncbi:MAG: SDR family NAD(P)-dependent oxidoreductase, partial [Bacteroidales bacterium]